MTPIERLDRLIAEAEQWRENYKREGFGIEAAACAIRIAALRDARRLVEKA